MKSLDAPSKHSQQQSSIITDEAPKEQEAPKIKHTDDADHENKRMQSHHINHFLTREEIRHF
jgi:hypothetical protein